VQAVLQQLAVARTVVDLIGEAAGADWALFHQQALRSTNHQARMTDVDNGARHTPPGQHEKNSNN
jgi:hypothetical protein